ncbi:YacP-like NYN domain-containing protein [Lactiplantibacillus mudanjiangensis]|uniref:Nuclease, NYN_YacP family [Lactobacillus plantarum ZJ316] n=1 Tax=Lactiplantibacillus mudanjiangensis TaxID=1296538 RepID=A0A660DYS4_9LACO|nr:NYN domain-containing protein [Lactiplantibacillus mudanjiangensis]VDG18002.1 Nuclease, NYN_YacP family [Lactobacillus plantarum ZJ316] [Lactiplantibacillus mudanjiangensis]VDG24832.1 Nuclease, NYN_YacP family [Lactobacillus plantarum ZJ316] [Lactiplantibacillus mudanjiangensis]VDG28421.1 Nuclease, NYN_YacP family [Lactobacillus plantarum ZJ316] [Lactiplantibacillus mudanjiangensis]VDG32295.1 Nuclease, NYN_YacP family [Lactobacillus plantarum ZJ316] [Lactiplantibacillus mudanjiangensis]
MKRQLLIVDAYNMIGNWPELNQLKQTERLPEARDELLAALTEYKKISGLDITVVFDAMYVPGNSKSYRQADLEIVWTSKDQTADSYIEKLAGDKQSRVLQVTVATSDQAEQWVIFSEGALRIPALELRKRVRESLQEVRHTALKSQDLGSVRKSPWNDRQLSELDKFRQQLEQTPEPPYKRK